MKQLFERTNLAGIRLKNRIFMSPMGTGTDPDGGFSEQSRRYYEDRAKGGFGLIILGATTCTTKYEPKPCNVLDSQPMVERLQRVVESVHAHGAKVVLQVSAGIGRMAFSDPTNPPYAASAVPGTFFPDMICRPLSIEQIHDIEESFGNTAMWAKAAGCDGIMIQGYGGYLIDQFMTPLWNKREDEYGGSLENRMRFTLNLIRNVQKKCGRDFPILFKLTLTHLIEGGRTVEEGLEIAKMLEQAGVCELHVDHGCFEVWNKPIPTVYDEFGGKVEIAAKVKEVVKIPVSCDGKLDDPRVALEAVSSGKVDYIGLGKQSIADPDWPRKVKKGYTDEIRYCIGCNECLLGLSLGRLVECAVNPVVGYEDFSTVAPAPAPKTVLVVGGGIAGMQTAITAADRGHQVIILEKTYQLGGMGIAAGAPDFKESVRRYIGYLVGQVQKRSANITVRFGVEATEAYIHKLRPDSIVLATGAAAKAPPVPGLAGNPKAAPAVAYLMGKAQVGKTVIVVGAGLIGCETALDISRKGADVLLVEALDKLAPREAINANNSIKLHTMIAQSNITVCLGAQIKQVTEEEAVIVQNGRESHIPYDSILFATGMSSNDQLAGNLYEQYDEVFLIGDAEKPGKILAAVHQGFHVAKNML